MASFTACPIRRWLGSPFVRLTATHAKRRNARDVALAKANEAAAADDWKTADKFFKQAVKMTQEFVAWAIKHLETCAHVRLVVAPPWLPASLALRRLPSLMYRRLPQPASLRGRRLTVMW